MEFADNSLLPALFGDGDEHLSRIERQLGVSLAPRGNRIAIGGDRIAIEVARAVLRVLYARLQRGLEITQDDIDSTIRMAAAPSASEMAEWQDVPALKTRKRQILPRTPMQGRFIRALRECELVFGIGPAGSGKTYLAVAAAVDMLMTGEVERIILCRPAVEAGERLGFLPGDMKEKIDPYLRPLYDGLHDMLPHDQVMKRLATGEIEVAPLAFMRGRTLAHAFVILDEAQNTTPAQMKMFLTRLGEGARMAVTGDLTQIDLPRGVRSGLADAVATLSEVSEIAVIRFTEADVVRHPLVARIVGAYDARDAAGPVPGVSPEGAR